MIQDEELTRIERRVYELVTGAGDTGGVSLLENAEWAARSLARVCREFRDLQQHTLQAKPSLERGPAVCDCPLCASDPRLLAMSRSPK